jgi:hypothetical protein
VARALLGLLVALVAITLLLATWLPGIGGVGFGQPLDTAGRCRLDVDVDGMPQADRRVSCTPGRYALLTRAQACTSKDRPSLSAADRRAILAKYGVPGWSGRDGELDHMVPFWAGGRTNAANVWPEPGTIPNLKDRLENYAYRAVCLDRTMSLQQVRRVFRGDWRVYYRRFRAAGLVR